MIFFGCFILAYLNFDKINVRAMSFKINLLFIYIFYPLTIIMDVQCTYKDLSASARGGSEGVPGFQAPSAELHRGCLEPSEQEGFWNSLNQMVPGTLGTRGFLEPSEPQEKKETYLIGQVFFVPKN